VRAPARRQAAAPPARPARRHPATRAYRRVARGGRVRSRDNCLLTPSRAASFQFFETFSYLPPLDDAAVAKQVDYITRNGWVPCLEFADADKAYVSDTNTIRMQKTNCYQVRGRRREGGARKKKAGGER
jgi:hypothetical protein